MLGGAQMSSAYRQDEHPVAADEHREAPDAIGKPAGWNRQ